MLPLPAAHLPRLSPSELVPRRAGEDRKASGESAVQRAEVIAMNPTIPVAPGAATPRPREDLSSEIIKALEKRPADRVTCRWISDDNYRCNWWAPMGIGGYDNPRMTGLTVTTHRVRQSRFLTVTKSAEGLVIAERGVRAAG